MTDKKALLKPLFWVLFSCFTASYLRAANDSIPDESSPCEVTASTIVVQDPTEAIISQQLTRAFSKELHGSPEVISEFIRRFSRCQDNESSYPAAAALGYGFLINEYKILSEFADLHRFSTRDMALLTAGPAPSILDELNKRLKAMDASIVDTKSFLAQKYQASYVLASNKIFERILDLQRRHDLYLQALESAPPSSGHPKEWLTDKLMEEYYFAATRLLDHPIFLGDPAAQNKRKEYFAQALIRKNTVLAEFIFHRIYAERDDATQLRSDEIRGYLISLLTIEAEAILEKLEKLKARKSEIHAEVYQEAKVTQKSKWDELYVKIVLYFHKHRILLRNSREASLQKLEGLVDEISGRLGSLKKDEIILPKEAKK